MAAAAAAPFSALCKLQFDLGQLAGQTGTAAGWDTWLLLWIKSV
jgi:hypothetical protein